MSTQPLILDNTFVESPTASWGDCSQAFVFLPQNGRSLHWRRRCSCVSGFFFTVTNKSQNWFFTLITLIGSLEVDLFSIFVHVIFFIPFRPVSFVQAWYYFTHQKDSWPLKTLVSHSYTFIWYRSLPWLQVAAVMCFDTIHQMLISHTGKSYPANEIPANSPLVYVYVITNYNNPVQLQNLVWCAFLIHIYPCRPLTRSSPCRSILVGTTNSKYTFGPWRYAFTKVEVLFNVRAYGTHNNLYS